MAEGFSWRWGAPWRYSKAKKFSPAGRASASAPLGPPQPVAPAACGQKTALATRHHQARAPLAVVVVFLVLAEPRGWGPGWAFNPSSIPIEQRSAALALRYAAGKGPLPLRLEGGLLGTARRRGPKSLAQAPALVVWARAMATGDLNLLCPNPTVRLFDPPCPSV
jgi:hypothetical protein